MSNGHTIGEKMNEFDLKKLLNEKFSEYMFFKSYEDTLGAFFRLGEIYNCVPRLEKEERSHWLEVIRKEKLNEQQIQLIKSDLERKVKEMEKLLAVFSDWIFEEIVLILTIRIYVDLAIALLNELGYLEESFDLKDIDAGIRDISKSKSSKHDFEASVNSIRKNWGLPIAELIERRILIE
jgi:hypothetical protein